MSALEKTAAAEIGSAIGITGQTVKGYLKMLFPKLGAANRAHELNLI